MNWIKKSVTRSMNTRNHYKLHDIDIFIKDALPDHVDPNMVFSYVSKSIPSSFLRGIDIIYIGKFDIFKEKSVNAIFQDGAIFVSNHQDSTQDLIDDIVHEIAHSVEENYRNIVYGDELLKKEFIGKRKKLYWILQTHDYKPYSKIQSTYHYDKEIDMYFYKEVGYEAMWNIIIGLFLTPYSTTSLREYFAVGFEEYFIGDRSQLRALCPILYSKLIELDSLEA